MTIFNYDESLERDRRWVEKRPEPERTISLIKCDYLEAHNRFRKAIVKADLDLSECQRHLDAMFAAVEKLPKSRWFSYYMRIDESLSDLEVWRFGRPERKKVPQWHQYFPNALQVWLWRNYKKPDLVELTRSYQRIDIVDFSQNSQGQ
jgi:hypothetical protein